MSLWTWTLATDFLSVMGGFSVASWHLAVNEDTLTAPQHIRVTLGIWNKIGLFLTRHDLQL